MMILRRAAAKRVNLRLAPARFIATESYLQKLEQRAKEQGKSVEELKESAKDYWREQAKKEKNKLQQEHSALLPKQEPREHTSTAPLRQEPLERHDASPVKPLSSILNMQKVLASPHTPKQIADLWVSYHALRADGSGKGYISASIPTEIYTEMASLAKQYSSLVVPLPRPKDANAPASENSDPYEFYFLQWDFHHSPPQPTPEQFSDPFYRLPTSSPNPRISTIIFTPLQEYKLRGAYATPYLVLTNYTDLASTHDLVLLRGEITPSPSNPNGHMLKQEDAHTLAMTLQKFFLWGDRGGQGKELLKTFHERPEEFKWEELIEYARL